MIKAVFFDFYHTLVRYEPPREELMAKALKDLGINVRPEILQRPLVTADEFIYQEIARLPLSQRSEEEKMALYTQHQGIVLKEAGIAAGEKLLHDLMGKMYHTQMKLVLFEDVAPVLDNLKGRGLVLGLISNVEHDINPTLREMGLLSWLDVVVTSQESGFAKPRPEIFREALRRGKVRASESIYVGDQYQVDCMGAKSAGMKPVLLDRHDYYEDRAGCPRLRSLSELLSQLP